MGPLYLDKVAYLGDLHSASRIYAALRNVQKRIKTLCKYSKTDKNCIQSFENSLLRLCYVGQAGQVIQKQHTNIQKLYENGQKFLKIFDTWLVKREAYLDGGIFWVKVA
jgi:hypothetical protein